MEKKKPPRSRAVPRIPKRQPLIWEHPDVPPELREAARPVFSDDELALIPAKLVAKLEKERQDKIAMAHRTIEEPFVRTEIAANASDAVLKAFDNEIKAGRKVLSGGIKGRDKAHGSDEERAARDKIHISAIRALRTKKPKLPMYAVFEIVGMGCNPPVSGKTVQRAWIREKKRGQSS